MNSLCPFMCNLIQDGRGTSADVENNLVVQAIQKIARLYPQVLIACDLCLCPYTDHGHCGMSCVVQCENMTAYTYCRHFE